MSEGSKYVGLKITNACRDSPRAWARKFLKAYPETGLTEAAMIDWFTGAIEHSHDVRAQRRRDRGYGTIKAD